MSFFRSAIEFLVVFLKIKYCLRARKINWDTNFFVIIDDYSGSLSRNFHYSKSENVVLYIYFVFLCNMSFSKVIKLKNFKLWYQCLIFNVRSCFVIKKFLQLPNYPTTKNKNISNIIRDYCSERKDSRAIRAKNKISFPIRSREFSEYIICTD